MHGGFSSRKALGGLLCAVAVGYLAWDYWDAGRAGAVSQPITKKIPNNLPPLPKPIVVDKPFSALVIEGKTYSDVKVRSVTPSSMSIIHRDGSATLPLAGASKEIRGQFGYDASKALAYEQLKAAHESVAQDLRLHQELLATKPASNKKRKPLIVDWVQAARSWVEGIFAKPMPAPTPDPGIVRNRKEVIRFYERVIEDLEKLNRQRAVASDRKSSGSLLPASQESLRVGSSSPASEAHNKQIQEYRERIAKLKKEIGE